MPPSSFTEPYFSFELDEDNVAITAELELVAELELGTEEELLGFELDEDNGTTTVELLELGTVTLDKGASAELELVAELELGAR